MRVSENTHAIQFYQREQFVIQFENIDENTNKRVCNNLEK